MHHFYFYYFYYYYCFIIVIIIIITIIIIIIIFIIFIIIIMIFIFWGIVHVIFIFPISKVIQTQSDGDVVIQIGDDEPVKISEIPETVKTYSDETLMSFATGFQTARVNDNTQELLQYFNTTFMDNERESQQALEQMQTSLVADVSQSITDLDTKFSNGISDLETSINVEQGKEHAKTRATVDNQLKAMQDKVDALTLALSKVSESNGDGKTEKNAATSCKAIKTKYASSANGQYYLTNPHVGLSARHSLGGHGFYTKGFVKVYCNFADGWTYNETNGNLFRMSYFPSQTEPYTLITFKAKYEMHAYGAAGGHGYWTTGGMTEWSKQNPRQNGGYGGKVSHSDTTSV